MKYLSYYKSLNLNNTDQVFEYFISTLRPGVTDWEYLVDWKKVFLKTKEIELHLNKLNYLLGKDNFDQEFSFLIKNEPSTLRAIPALLVRTSDKSSKFNILSVQESDLVDKTFDFGKSSPNDEDIKNYIEFIRKSGLIKIFEKDGVKNLVDYVLGVEAGLNSNARKNRGGKSMEAVCEALLKSFRCDYLSQATQSQINAKFGTNLRGGEGRQYDFAVLAKNGVNIIEVNCYSGGGSKLDKTASDYINLQKDIGHQATFIWITDGYGWVKTKNPIRKTFESNDYILNIKMVKDGAFEEILNKESRK